MDEIIEQQGWNDSTVLQLALDFIRQHGLTGEFEEYLEKQADEENEEAADLET